VRGFLEPSADSSAFGLGLALALGRALVPPAPVPLVPAPSLRAAGFALPRPDGAFGDVDGVAGFAGAIEEIFAAS
jgi:hypothetical protein